MASNIEFLDFYADWCGPCQVMKPIIEELENELKDIHFSKIDVEKDEPIASEYNVMSLPTYIIKKDGEIIDKFSGIQSKEELINKLK